VDAEDREPSVLLAAIVIWPPARPAPAPTQELRVEMVG
jgi:hypothetical protein